MQKNKRERSAFICLAGGLVLAVWWLIFAPLVQAQSTGQWSALQNLPYEPVHTIMLPNGTVLFFGTYGASFTPQIWTPSAGSAAASALSPYEIFCSGHTQLEDGRVFLAGGNIDDTTGYAHATIYDPNLNTFTQVPDMNAGRWYPTNTVLGNGNVLVVSGDITSDDGPDPVPEIYQVASNSWLDLTSAQLQMPTYPVMLLAPNGLVFNAGPGSNTRFLNTTGTGAWTAGPTLQYGTRDYGPGLLYNVGNVLEVGGGDPPTNTAEITNLNSATPAWAYTGAMNNARRQHNAVILPDGTVLVVGGSSGSGFDNADAPVFPAELWNPSTGQWTVMASIATYRGYHSTAFLLPTGTVFSGGGDVGGANYQIFSPPYLFAGAQPTISSAPASVTYGETQKIGTPNAKSIKQVSFIRLPATTHTFDQSQRFIPLTFAQTSGGLKVTFPANGNIAPPGYYMLFLVNSSGVPSVAAIMQITATGGNSTGTVKGKVTDVSTGKALSKATVTWSGGSAATSTTGAYTLQRITAGAQAVTASASGYVALPLSANVTGGKTETLNFPLAIGGTIAVQVNGVSGLGFQDADVSASGGIVPTVASGTTDAIGNYTTPLIPVGTYTITVIQSSQTTQTQNVTVTAGKTATVAITNF